MSSDPAGSTRMWGLDPDVLTIGKSIAGGRAARRLRHDRGGCGRPAAPGRPRTTRRQAIATGGTLFGNPLSMAAARATMGQVLTDEAYARTHALGARLADGIEKSDPRRRSPLDHPSLLAALRRDVRAGDAAQRPGGLRRVGRPAHARLPALPREPRRLGGDRRRRTHLLDPGHRGRRRPVREGLRLADRRADGLGPARGRLRGSLRRCDRAGGARP